ncbi:MAG TPA: NUDIX domain-containing protein [Streptosporangiaceae bacterium]|nr:NUDIX domain-containing protein [Streptosporangiaceae bacterium]
MSPRFQVTPAVHLILRRERDVLLLRRFNTGYEDGNYSLPAGHLDGAETVSAAMIREAAEEVGVVISPADLRMAHVMHRNVAAPGGEPEERVDFFLAARRWRGTPVVGEPDKCDEVTWYPVTDLPGNVVPYVRSALECCQRGVSFSEFGWPPPARPAVSQSPGAGCQAG